MARDKGKQPARCSASIDWDPEQQDYVHADHGIAAQENAALMFEDNDIMMHNTREAPTQSTTASLPHWPSMLNTQLSTHHATLPQLMNSSSPVSTSSAMPVTAASWRPVTTPATAPSSSARLARSITMPIMPTRASSSRSITTTTTSISSTPRRALTDADRRLMCQYAEQNPDARQTEIGAKFGVERSTVSKVLRQKEKYLRDDGSRSPVKKVKHRLPDLERALANWAKNQEKLGVVLTDDVIRERARAFAATTSTPNTHVAMTASWIEMFKLNNNLLGPKSRKSSWATDDANNNLPTFGTSVTSTSPTSSIAGPSTSPFELHSAQSYGNLQYGSPDAFMDFDKPIFHSQSTSSLHSAFTDTTSAFSSGAFSPASPFYTPDSGVAPSPFSVAPRPDLLFMSHQRPRSQTLPLLDGFALSSTNEASTPRYSTSHMLDSPMEEAVDPLGVNHVSSSEYAANMPQDNLSSSHFEHRYRAIRPHPSSSTDAMGPPPLPAAAVARRRPRSITPATSVSSIQAAPSTEEARNALQLVLNYFEHQPNGSLDTQDSFTLGKLVEKLRIP